MNILFVIDNVNATGDANINLVKKLAAHMEKEGNKVYFAGHRLTKEVDGFSFYYPWDEKVRGVFFSLSGKGLRGKILTLLSHPFLSFLGLFKVFNIDLISHFYKKKIQRLCPRYDIGAVVSVSAPFYTAKGLAKAKIKAKKIILMFDPYAKHYTFGNKRTEKMEKRCFDAADRVFLPVQIAGEYNDPKVCGIEFPGVSAERLPVREAGLLDKDKINLVYAGSLYADIRSPAYLYDLLRRLEDDRVHLTVVGGVYGEFTQDFYDKYSDFIKRHVTLTGRLPKEEANMYISRADVLVNIGNLVDNMLPSKVLECISTGKPVLNIAQIKNCPSLPYFEKYGNALTFFTVDSPDRASVDKLREFIYNRTDIDREKILSDFAAATPEYVAGQILKAVYE